MLGGDAELFQPQHSVHLELFVNQFRNVGGLCSESFQQFPGD